MVLPDLWIQCGQQVADKLGELLPEKHSNVAGELRGVSSVC